MSIEECGLRTNESSGQCDHCNNKMNAYSKCDTRGWNDGKGVYVGNIAGMLVGSVCDDPMVGIVSLPYAVLRPVLSAAEELFISRFYTCTTMSKKMGDNRVDPPPSRHILSSVSR